MGQGEFSFTDSYRPTASRKRTKASGRKAAKSAGAQNVPVVYSVTQLTRLVKLTLNEHLPAKITVTGEISNFKRHSSGHLYLTLKDENAQLPAVMWRSHAERLKFKPADGLAVVATGRIDLFEPQGKYQFYIEKLDPEGTGALELAFRQLADALRKEGLFDEDHKKTIPTFPNTIAIVTSSTGAVIEDITKTLNRRFPIVRKLLYPVAVQGEGAAAKIARAICELNRRQEEFGGIDVLIVGRGGGSIEDLWAFNEEIVARAIYQSNIPILSAVGHETDTTIADLVADQRAATPTAAAELAVPVLADLLGDNIQYQIRLQNAMNQKLEAAGRELKNLASRPVFTRPLEAVRYRQQTLDEQSATLAQMITERFHREARKLETSSAVLRHIEPHYALKQANHKLQQLQHLIHGTLTEFYRKQKHRLETQSVTLHAASPGKHLEHNRVLLANLIQRTTNTYQQATLRRRQHLNHLQVRLENLNPRSILARGYSITRCKTTNRILKVTEPIRSGDLLTTELADSMFMESQVTAPPAKKKFTSPDR
jgi:exodeoxyribonuclease VII large subunit